jgi:hypothetical protein
MMVGMGGEAGLSEVEWCLRVQVVGSAGLSLEGGPEGDVIPTPMPAIEPCLVARDPGSGFTPSMDRTGGGVAVLLSLVADGLVGLAFLSASSKAMTSRRSSSRAASKLMMGVCGARARVGELPPAMVAGGRRFGIGIAGGNARGSELSSESLLAHLQTTLPAQNYMARQRMEALHCPNVT